MKSKIEEAREALVQMTTINSELFTFCYHTHYEHPRFSVWRTNTTLRGSASLQVKEGVVSLLDAGSYSPVATDAMQKELTAYVRRIDG